MYIDRVLIRKYNQAGPRYTSYPPANHFTESFTRNDYIGLLRASNHQEPQSISLYIHIPFCPQICYFCGCNTNLTGSGRQLRRYIDALKKEIRVVASHLDRSRPLTQIHWGGGTPNSLPFHYIREVMDQIYELFTLSEHPEIAMECSPAYLGLKDVVALARMGFNRMSLGIQDMNPDLLRKLNRRPQQYPLEDLYRTAKKSGFEGVNFDFVYGLPGQSLEDHLTSIDRALEIAPERIVTFSYAHVPWFKEHQKKLEVYHLPDASEKLTMLESAFQRITGQGYLPIGMDHYAQPNDELALALKNRTLHRNFQGYTTREKTGQVYAFGATGISQLSGGYSQNTRSLNTYINTLEKDELPVLRGYRLSQDEKIRRRVLNEIMCNHHLDFNDVAGAFGIEAERVKKIVEYDEGKLEAFARDGLVKYTGHKVEITPRGFFLIRNIAMKFDPLMSRPTKGYSKTI